MAGERMITLTWKPEPVTPALNHGNYQEYWIVGRDKSGQACWIISCHDCEGGHDIPADTDKTAVMFTYPLPSGEAEYMINSIPWSNGWKGISKSTEPRI